jgi:IS30 family transposase
VLAHRPGAARPRARTRGRGKKFVTPEIMVSQRPAEAADRAVPEHWEFQWCCQAAGASFGGVAA